MAQEEGDSMKIGVNTLFFIPAEVGGTETYLTEVLREMAALSGSDQFVLFTNRENDGHLRRLLSICPNVSFHCLPVCAMNRYVRIVAEQTILPLQAARAAVDILWSPGYTAPFFVSCPQVVTIHDMQYKRYPEDFGVIARWTTALLVNMAIRRCRRIIAVSEFSGQEIIYFAGIKRGKVHVINEAASSIFSESLTADEKRKRLKGIIKSDRPYLLCVANSYPHKNIPVLIEAFNQLQNEIPHDLILVGQPRLGEPNVEQALRQIKDPSRVQRLFHVSREELIALYQDADLFVFPSLYEGFGLPVLEAMMSGVPVLTTRMGSIPEVGGDHVQYFDGHNTLDLSQRIKSILAWDEKDRRTIIRKAQAHAKGFSWRHCAEATFNCFRETFNE
jgi:glycosyltransferase involved in cell wall biosynthesis